MIYTLMNTCNEKLCLHQTPYKSLTFINDALDSEEEEDTAEVQQQQQQQQVDRLFREQGASNHQYYQLQLEKSFI